jgi:hypothetical protein
MANRYRRVARTVAEAGLGLPVPLRLAIREVAASCISGERGGKTVTRSLQTST